MNTDEYRLVAARIEDNLKTARVGRSVLCFDTVDSTNDVAWDSTRHGDTDGLVVVAESQRSGRGRFKREWISEPSQGLLFSVLLFGDVTGDYLTLAAGIGVAEGIEEFTGLDAELKWPNDVIIGGAKAAGILVEQRAPENAAVVGIGVNVNCTPVPNSVAYPATSLARHMGRPVDRTGLLREILVRLDSWIGFEPRAEKLHNAWISRCGMINQRVTVESEGRKYTGRVLDIDPMQGLDLVDDRGTRVHLPARWSTVVEGGGGEA